MNRKTGGRKFFAWVAVLLVGGALALALVPRGEASAAISLSDAVKRKWAFTQFYLCATNIPSDNLILENKTSGGLVVDDVFGNSITTYNPGFVGKYGTEVKCSGAINDEDGVLHYYNSSLVDVNWSDFARVEKLLEAIGYTKEESGDQDRTIEIWTKYDWEKWEENPFRLDFWNSNTINVSSGQNQLFGTMVTTPTSDGNTNYQWTPATNSSVPDGIELVFRDSDGDGNNEEIVIKVVDNYDTTNTGIGGAIDNYGEKSTAVSGFNNSVVVKLQKSVDDFIDILAGRLSRDGSQALANRQFGRQLYKHEFNLYYTLDQKYTFGSNPDEFLKYTHTSSQYIYKNQAVTAKTATSDMFGSYILNVNLTDAERYALYYEYLNEYLPSGLPDRLTCNPTIENPENTLYKVKLKSGSGGFETCYINLNGANPSETSVVTQVKTSGASSRTNGNPMFTTITMQQVIDWFNNLTDDQMDDIAGAVQSVVDDNGNNDTPVSDAGWCYSNGAGKSLGWLLCSVMDWMGDAVQGLYDEVVEPSLRIEPQLFASDSKGGQVTKDAWGTFQGIANILIMILFLVVIFSQLTGVGIDNYGIKKILPRIIIAAVLMNLSYYICEACVDLSNILGNSLQGLFNGLAGQIPLQGEYSTTVIEGAGSAILSVGLMGLLVGGGLLVTGGWMMALLALIPALFSLVISIFFLFVLLAGRQAAVVVLVVIAPLAFVCYTLPNTKKLFDKWVNVGKALLLVYPIAGLLIGGGNFVSRVLLASGIGDSSFATALVAMLVGIVPIFFIPSVLRKAMDGLGGIGTRISGLGNRLGQRGAGAIRNSEQFRFQQQRAQERRNLRLSGMQFNEKGELEERTGFRGRRLWRNRLKETGFGRWTGMDRMQGRRMNQAQQSGYAAENERLNSRLDIMNAQQARTNDALDNRVGEAEAYEEKRQRQTDYEKRRERAGKRELARQTTADNLKEQSGKVEDAIRTREAELSGSSNRPSVATDVEAARRRAEAARMKKLSQERAWANYRPEKGESSLYNQNTLDQMAMNELEMIGAQQRTGVSEVNRGLANLRAMSAFKAQEFKNATDMYSTFSKSQLMEAAGMSTVNGRTVMDPRKIATMLGEQGGAQRMIALTNAMMSNGLENALYNDVLGNDQIGKMIGSNKDIMTAYASSSDKALKAYGKTGEGLSFREFMMEPEDVLDNNGKLVFKDGKPVRRTRMQKYIDGKGADFIRDLSDKTLGQLVKYSDASRGEIEFMDTSLLMQAESRLEEQSAVDYLDYMVNKAAEKGPVNFSGNELTNFNLSTVQTLGKSANGRAALLKASEDVAKNRDLATKVKTGAREEIDALREANGLAPIWGQNGGSTGGPNGGSSGDSGPQGGGNGGSNDGGGTNGPVGPASGTGSSYDSATAETWEAQANNDTSNGVDWDALNEPYNNVQPAPQGGAPEPTPVYGGGASSASVDTADRLNQIVNEEMPGMNSVVDNMMADQLMREASMAANGTGDGRRIAEQLMRSPGLVQALTVDSVKALPDRALIDAISSSSNIEAKQKLVSIAQQMRDNPELARGFTGPAKTALNNFLQFNDPNYTSRGPIQ